MARNGLRRTSDAPAYLFSATSSPPLIQAIIVPQSFAAQNGSPGPNYPQDPVFWQYSRDHAVRRPYGLQHCACRQTSPPDIRNNWQLR